MSGGPVSGGPVSGGPGPEVVVGSLDTDLVLGVERHPAPGETVLGTGPVSLPGGKGANQAVAAARLGARTGVVGAVGEDAAADVALSGLREAGADTRAAASAGTRVLLNLAPPADIASDVVALADPLVVDEHEATAVPLRTGSEGAQGAALEGRGAQGSYPWAGAPLP